MDKIVELAITAHQLMMVELRYLLTMFDPEELWEIWPEAETQRNLCTDFDLPLIEARQYFNLLIQEAKS